MLMEKLIALMHDESGLTIVEYAVAGSLITVAVILSFTALGAAVGAVIDTITAAL